MMESVSHSLNMCVSVCEGERERGGERGGDRDIYVNWLLFIRFRKYRIVNRISILLNLQRVVAIHRWRDQSRLLGSARFGLQSPPPVPEPDLARGGDSEGRLGCASVRLCFLLASMSHDICN